MRTDRVAAITMVHGPHFLAKWIAHNEALFGRENLFVLSHGADPTHDALCGGLNHVTLPRAFSETFEPARIAMINDIVNGLLQVYGHVVFTDVDELVALDPAAGGSLVDYLRETRPEAVAPIGLDVVPPAGAPLDWKAPILGQTRHVAYASHFCKPAIRSVRAHQDVGGHAMDRPFAVDPNLLLFHLKFADTRLHDRYAALTEEIRAFTGPYTGMKKWQRFHLDAPGLTPDPTVGDWPERRPAEATEGARKVIEAKAGWHRCQPGQEVPPFRLPETFRDLL